MDDEIVEHPIGEPCHAAGDPNSSGCRGARPPPRSLIVDPPDRIGNRKIIEPGQPAGSGSQVDGMAGRLAFELRFHQADPMQFLGVAHPGRNGHSEHITNHAGLDCFCSTFASHDFYVHVERSYRRSVTTGAMCCPSLQGRGSFARRAKQGRVRR